MYAIIERFRSMKEREESTNKSEKKKKEFLRNKEDLT
jgi:hypothetical protein